MNRTYTILILIGVIILAGGTGYYLYQQSIEDARVQAENAKQPNIQTTQTSITAGSLLSNIVYIVSPTRISSSYSYNFKTTIDGSYTFYFDNGFSTFSSKTVHITYSTTNPVTNYDNTFTLPAGKVNFWYATFGIGQQVTISITVTGGSGNDVDFHLNTATHSRKPTFKTTLVNAGTADGFAEVAFYVDGISAWTNKYFIKKGESQTVSGSCTVNDNLDHTYNFVVVKQYK
jgi:uncharacterized protein (UPF0333 family)